MLKKLGAIIAFLGLVSLKAQEVKDYKYIIIPENFSGFEKNKYQLKNRLNHFLKQKKYTTISYNQDNWNQELINNPCITLSVDIKKLKSLATNKIELEFTDCSKQIVANYEGISKIKDFETGYQEAVELAIAKLDFSSPTITASNLSLSNSNKVKKKESSINKQPIVNEVIIQNNLLTDGKALFQKIDKNKGGFLLMSENGNNVIATFEPTLKAGIYRVSVNNGDTKYATVGYGNGDSISYEIIENNNWIEVKLQAKK